MALRVCGGTPFLYDAPGEQVVSLEAGGGRGDGNAEIKGGAGRRGEYGGVTHSRASCVVTAGVCW